MVACWTVDLMVAGSNPAAVFFNFSCKIEILVEGDRRTIRFMGKKMADLVQLRRATLYHVKCMEFFSSESSLPSRPLFFKNGFVLE